MECVESHMTNKSIYVAPLAYWFLTMSPFHPHLGAPRRVLDQGGGGGVTCRRKAKDRTYVGRLGSCIERLF